MPNKLKPNLWNCAHCHFTCFDGEDVERHMEVGHEEATVGTMNPAHFMMDLSAIVEQSTYL